MPTLSRLQDVLRSHGHECVVSPLTPPAQAVNRLAQANAQFLVVVLSQQDSFGQLDPPLAVISLSCCQLDFGHSGRVAGDLDELLQYRPGDFGDLPAAP